MVQIFGTKIFFCFQEIMMSDNYFDFVSGRVSLIIPTVSRNKLVSIKSFLKKRYLLQDALNDISIFVRGDIEVIVLCNSSNDTKLLELIQTHSAVDKWAVNSINIGVPRSWNQGAQMATGEFLCFMNDDVEIRKGAIEKMVSWFIDKKIGQVGPKGTYWWRQTPGDYVGLEKPSEADAISGWLFMLPAKVFYEIGGIDNFYSPAFMEEIDLSFAIRNAGYMCMVDPSIEAEHHHISGASSTNRPIEALGSSISRDELTSRNRDYFEKKWEKFWK